MEVFHGTSQLFADKILGPPVTVDVTKGRGELGQGFYVGNEPSLAAALARGRHNSDASVLQFTIDVKEYLKLDIKTVNRVAHVIANWRALIASKSTTTHRFWVDVVAAPFATINFAHQYKFESEKAQVFLNNSSAIKVM